MWLLPRVRYPLVMPNQIAAVTVRVIAASTQIACSRAVESMSGRVAAGQGLPRLDGGEMEQVTRLGRQRGQVLGRTPPGGFDLGDMAEVVGQVLRVFPSDR